MTKRKQKTKQASKEQQKQLNLPSQQFVTRPLLNNQKTKEKEKMVRGSWWTTKTKIKKK